MLSDDLLEEYREDLEDTFWDTCQIGRYIATRDSFGQAINDPVYGAEIPCRLSFGQRIASSVLDILNVRLSDGRLELPFNTVVRAGDLIKIIKYHGANIDPIIFTVIGHPRRGLGGLALALEWSS